MPVTIDTNPQGTYNISDIITTNCTNNNLLILTTSCTNNNLDIITTNCKNNNLDINVQELKSENKVINPKIESHELETIQDVDGNHISIDQFINESSLNEKVFIEST